MMLRALLLVGLVGISGCEKAGPKSSGPLAAADTALLRDLPAGNVALIGGNFMKLQDFMSSTWGKGATQLLTKANRSDGFARWMQCFGELKDVQFLGGMAFRAAGTVEMHGAFAHLQIDDLARCARSASFSVTTDPDGKFAGIEIPYLGTTMQAGYLVLPDGALYFRQVMKLGVVPSITPTTRSDLEADVAALAHGTAADDQGLLAIAAKVDRSQTMWFAATGANTPLGDKVGELYGTFDFSSGLSCDLTVQLKDSALAEKAETGFRELKRNVGQLPAKLKAAIEGIELHRDGDHLRVVMKLSEAQLGDIMSTVGGGLPH